MNCSEVITILVGAGENDAIWHHWVVKG